MQLVWPGALKPVNVTWHLEQQSRSGGASITGSEQIVSSGAGRWRASVDVVARRHERRGPNRPSHPNAEREEAVLALRGFIAAMEGRVGEVVLPTFDGYRPRDDQGHMLSGCHQASLDGLFFFEHWGFGQDEFTHAILAANASLGATQITVNVLDGQGPRPGHYFGIGERLYIAQQTWQDNPDGVTFIRFAPRLRAAATSGTRVILDRPVCRMRLASDDTGELTLEMRRWGQTTIEFVEAW